MVEEYSQGQEYDSVIRGIAHLHKRVGNIRHNTATVLHLLPSWFLPTSILYAKYKHARDQVKYLGKEFGVITLNLPRDYAQIFGDIFGTTVWANMVIYNHLGDDFEERRLSLKEGCILTHMREYEAATIGDVREAIINGSASYSTTNELLHNFAQLQGIGSHIGRICVSPYLNIEGIESVINLLKDH